MGRTLRSDDKDHIISMIEDESRSGQAFDDDVVLVLKKLTTLNLLLLQRAFNQVYRIGVKDGQDK